MLKCDWLNSPYIVIVIYIIIKIGPIILSLYMFSVITSRNRLIAIVEIISIWV